MTPRVFRLFALAYALWFGSIAFCVWASTLSSPVPFLVGVAIGFCASLLLAGVLLGKIR